MAEGVLDAQELLAAAQKEEETSEKALRECVEGVLADAPRSGAPATFAPEQVVQIVALACEAPREDSGRALSHWTPRDLADEAVKRGIVGSISVRKLRWGVFWGEADLKPHLMRYWLNNERLSRAGGLRRGG